MSDPNQSVFSGLPKQSQTPAPAAKSKLPDALKGKSPDEIFDILQTEHVREMAEEGQKYTEKLESLAARDPQVASSPPTSPFPYSPPPAAQEPQFDLSNPDAYLDASVARRVAPLANAMASAGRDTGRALIQQRLPTGYWDRFKDEIEKFVDSVSPMIQVQPKIYEIAYNFVKGQHSDELIEERSKERARELAKQTLVEMGIEREMPGEPTKPQPRASLFQGNVGVTPTTSAPRSSSAALGGGRSKLSDAERQMAARFHMTEEEYLAGKEQNTDILSIGGRG